MKALIVGCLHGDEILGKQAIEKLKEKYDTYIANPEALKIRKRFIDEDMNRCFPGDVHGNKEQIAASFLMKQVGKYDLVIDIHSTKSDIKELVVVTSLNKKIINLLKFVPIKNVVLMPSKMAQKSFIKHCKLGISFEYRRKTKISSVILQIEKTINQKKEYKHEFYKVVGEYEVQEPFTPNLAIKELEPIPKMTIIGKSKKINYVADKIIIPLFAGKGRYKRTAFLMVEKL